MRDVVKPKVGHDPFPAPNSTIYQPGPVDADEDESEEDSDEETPAGPDPGPRRTGRARAPVQRLNLFTAEATYERIERALVTGSIVGNIGSGHPG